MTLLSSIRGDAYTGFLRAARRLLGEAGVPMQLHLHTEAFQPDPPHGALMGFPANLRFDWAEWLEEGLADATTLRMAWYEAMEPADAMGLRERLRDPAVEEKLEATSRNHIPVYLNRYAMAGGVTHTGKGMDRYLEDIEVAYSDPRLAGFDVYEVFTLVRPSGDGRAIEPIGDFAERLRQKARRLGIT